MHSCKPLSYFSSFDVKFCFIKYESAEISLANVEDKRMKVPKMTFLNLMLLDNEFTDDVKITSVIRFLNNIAKHKLTFLCLFNKFKESHCIKIYI
jgi:hypothetical protein